MTSASAEDIPPTECGGPDPYSNPARLFDAMLQYLALKNDAALARRLKVWPAWLSGVRRGRRLLSATLRARIHEASGLTRHELNVLIAAMPAKAVAPPPSPVPDRGSNSGKLLNALKDQLGLNSDSALARALEVDRPYISKIRHGKIAIGATLILRMQELSGLSVQELRALMDDRRKVARDDASSSEVA
jgi:transcriptional regulator with XRE-family HTH domain